MESKKIAAASVG